MKSFYVYRHFNKDGTLSTMDIMPCFLNWWYDNFNRRYYKLYNMKPETVKNFIEKEGKYHFWCKCEYEFIASSWPFDGAKKKIDVWQQIEMNLDVIVDIFIQNLKEDKRRKRNAICTTCSN